MANDKFHPYAATLNSIREFERRISFAPNQVHVLGEIKSKVRRLIEQYVRLVQLNDALAQQRPLKVNFDSETSVMAFNDGHQTLQFKLNRANPDIPISIRNSTAVIIYNASDESSSASDDEKKLRSELEHLLENYYQTAHRVQKLTTALLFPKRTRRKNPFECKEISKVRNHLIEHPKQELLYSFGYGTRGPIVRPSARGKQREWTDGGLIPNTEAFDQALAGAFDSVENPEK